MEWGFACVRRAEERKDMRKRYAEPKSPDTLWHRKRHPCDAQSEIEHNRKNKIEKSKGRWNEDVGFYEPDTTCILLARLEPRHNTARVGSRVDRARLGLVRMRRDGTRLVQGHVFELNRLLPDRGDGDGSISAYTHLRRHQQQSSSFLWK